MEVNYVLVYKKISMCAKFSKVKRHVIARDKCEALSMKFSSFSEPDNSAFYKFSHVEERVICEELVT